MCVNVSICMLRSLRKACAISLHNLRVRKAVLKFMGLILTVVDPYSHISLCQCLNQDPKLHCFHV